MSTIIISEIIEKMKATIRIFFQPGEVWEMRIPKAGRAGTVSGYFNNPEPFVKAVQIYNGKVPGIYFTLNPVKPALLARANNKVFERAAQTTSDHDIVTRRWLPVDIDPVRPAGISSTEEEHELALEKGREIRKQLKAEGWPEPIFASSGNGAHLLYPIDLPNDDKSRELVKTCLEALAFRFSDDKVNIDTSVFNAARIWKVYGTMSCKSENLPERPHRQAEILEMPEQQQVVSRAQLEVLAKLLPKAKPQGSYNGSSDFDLDEWIQKHNLEVLYTKTWQGGLIYALRTCPFDPGHGKDSHIIKMASGAIAFGCFHNGCSDKNWHSLRDLLEPAWRERAKNPQGTGSQKPGGTERRRALIISLAEVKATLVNWLWKPYIPLGKLTLLEGDPSVGKTWLALMLAAIISKDWPFPSPVNGRPEGESKSGTVLYMSAEDGLADTLKPRLDNMGADVNNIYVLTGSQDETGKLNGITLADLEIIEEALKRVKPLLLVVDPLQAYLGARVDMHRANEVRPVLAGLAGLAEKHNCAALCIRHLSKSPQGRAIYRGLGTIDFAAAARSILLLGQDPENEQKRAIVQTKNSLEKKGAAIAYEIAEGKFSWKGLSDMTAASILSPEASAEDRTAIEVAQDFLGDILQEGTVPSEEIFKEAKKQRIADKTLCRAKASLNINSQKIGKSWYWELPEEEKEENELEI